MNAHTRLLSLLLALAFGVACAGSTAPRADAPAVGSAGGAQSKPDSATAPAAPTEPVARLRVAYSSLSGSQVPVYLAYENGLFAKQGLDVEISYIASGSTSMQALIANEVQFSVGTGNELAAAYVGGAPVRLVLGWINTFPNLFMVDPSITSPEQLRGKPIGISRFGGQPHAAARLALKAWGMNPDSDVSYLQLGGVPEILAGMQSGVVVGGAFTPPTNIQARKLGYRVLGDLGQLGIPYQSTALLGQQLWLESNPDPARRFVRAMLEGIYLYLTDDVASRAALSKYTKTDDRDELDETIAYYRTIVQRTPYPTLEGLQTVLDDLADSDPRARAVQPSQLVNTTLLEAIEREGFLKQLYGG